MGIGFRGWGIGFRGWGVWDREFWDWWPEVYGLQKVRAIRRIQKILLASTEKAGFFIENLHVFQK